MRLDCNVADGDAGGGVAELTGVMSGPVLGQVEGGGARGGWGGGRVVARSTMRTVTDLSGSTGPSRRRTLPGAS